MGHNNGPLQILHLIPLDSVEWLFLRCDCKLSLDFPIESSVPKQISHMATCVAHVLIWNGCMTRFSGPPSLSLSMAFRNALAPTCTLHASSAIPPVLAQCTPRTRDSTRVALDPLGSLYCGLCVTLFSANRHERACTGVSLYGYRLLYSFSFGTLAIIQCIYRCTLHCVQ